MELSDLLDLLHYYYESDIANSSEYQLDAKNAVRKAMYSLLYDTEYEYSTERGSEISDENPYTSPPEGTIKPYIPPTSPEELQAMLGPALGE